MSTRISLFIGMTLACACASAQTPGPAARAPVPQPIAPSTLPYEGYQYGDHYPYAIYHDRYEYDTHGPCIAQSTSQDTSSETSDPAASAESAKPNAIDWCALAPYRPRYAPQIPASWWWHHRAPWRYGRTP
jgi:hypothetical protein